MFSMQDSETNRILKSRCAHPEQCLPLSESWGLDYLLRYCALIHMVQIP